MIRFNAIDYIAHILVIIGAINWGLIGFAGLYVISFLFRRSDIHSTSGNYTSAHDLG